MLGRVGVTGPAGSFEQRDLPGLQGAALVALLVIERRPLGREAVADVLWNGAPPAGWVSGLNSLLSKTRAQLDRAGIPRGVLISAGGTLEAALPAGSWVDMEAAARELDRAVAAHRDGRSDVVLPAATTAWAILRRPFLVGFDSPWADEQRRHLAAQFAVAAELLAEAYLDHGDARLALSIGESAIAAEGLRESAHRLVMRAHLASGNRALAVRAFERCAATLRTELGVEPSADTIAVLRASTPDPPVG